MPDTFPVEFLGFQRVRPASTAILLRRLAMGVARRAVAHESRVLRPEPVLCRALVHPAIPSRVPAQPSPGLSSRI